MRNRSWLPGSAVVPLSLLFLTLPLVLALSACDPDTRNGDGPDAAPPPPPPPTCVTGETRAHACGRCGLETAFCQGGEWGEYGTCQEPAVCRCNDGETVTRACGTCGTQTAACVDGAYQDFGACEEPQFCSCTEGQTQTQTCGTCGTQSRTCAGGTWGAFGTCDEPASCTCTDGQTQTQPCGSCGTQSRTCLEGTWTEFGQCQESGTCECQNGETNTRPCGNCGQKTRTCTSGTWSDFSACTDEGECAPGTIDTRACGSDVGACQAGTEARTCADSCTWSGYGACEGGATGPTAEVCGDQIDNNCNGVTDEGCSCGAVAAGAGGSFPVAGTIRKLVADPTGCTLYALATGTSSQVVVVDTSAKAEIGRINLPFASDDIDLSADGHTLVVSHDAIHKVSVIDLSAMSVASTLSVLSDPYALEVSNDGRVWYAELDQWVDVHRVDLADPTSDTAVGSWSFYQGDLELSADGTSLYGAESGISGGNLYKWSVGAGALTQVDRSTWDDNYGFPYPQRQLYLSPGGHDVYYAGYQLDANDLRFVRGHVGEPVYVGDRAEKIAVGGGHVFDSKLVRSIAALSPTPTAAALVADDRELWTYASGRLYYRNVDDFELGAQLGVRERTPGTIASYAFTHLVHDPVRPRLYGVSPTKNAVVAIDAVSLQPIVEIVVGATPTDIAVDADGSSLWVGHLDVLALARIDLASLTFDRFVVMPRDTFEVEPLAGGRIATVDEDQWTTVSIVDGTTGMVLASTTASSYQPALTATADGASLFVAESSLSGSNVTRYDVSAGTFVRVDESTYDQGYGFPYPARHALTLPDGSGLFYAGYRLHGSNLSILDYPMTDTILSVTPDGTRAISATKVYAASNGTLRGTLPTQGTVQAVSPDGQSLFVVAGNSIVKESLGGF